jgi:alpha-beta hydrolase superfamily lysophospholipase
MRPSARLDRALVLAGAVALAAVAPAEAGSPARPRAPVRARAAHVVERGVARVVSALLAPINTRARLVAHREHAETALHLQPRDSFTTENPRPLKYRLATARNGLSTRKTRRQLTALVGALEAQVGVIRVPVEVPRSERLFFRAERAAALKLLGRRASDLSSRYVTAGRQTVTGFDGKQVKIGKRRVLIETLQATGGAPRAVASIAHGYLEQTESWFDLADQASRQGIEVVLIGQQFGPESLGASAQGQMDSAEGVARDDALGSRAAQAEALRRGLPYVEMGLSLGGGPGTLLSQALVQDGRIRGPLGAPPLIVMAPYVAPSEHASATNLRIGRLPFLRELPIPGMPSHRELPAQRTLAARTARGAIAGRAAAFHRGTLTGPDLARIAKLPNDITLIMSPDDHTASFEAVRRALPRAKVERVATPDHTLENTTGMNRRIVGAMLDRLGLARRE